MSENTFVIVYEGDHLMAALLKSFLEEGGLQVYMENSNMSTIAPFQLTAGGMNPALLKVVNKEPVKPKEGSQSSARYHVIQSGDTFSKVSKIYGVSLNALMNANKDLNPKALRVGQEIVIP